ncbi:hypothetical protein AB0N17_02885 [Streptomyces sp. NPDC051133]|uniref:hypothetical protein n=1 Tax=Streptomyces sp. NPDC051133 TaxID=3155521 RepID=UPI003446B526
MITPAPEPGPPVLPLPPSPTPGCSSAGCLAAPLVQWQRRPTDGELEAVVAAEQARRDQVLAVAAPHQSTPVFGPLPTAADTTIAVYACGSHAISMNLAALVHASSCTAPDPELLPRCNCTPEPPPAPAPVHTDALPLPDHWQ